MALPAHLPTPEHLTAEAKYADLLSAARRLIWAERERFDAEDDDGEYDEALNALTALVGIKPEKE